MTGARKGAWTAFVAALALMAPQAQALSASDKCVAKENTIAGRYALGLQKAQAKSIKANAPPDHAKADAKFAASWMKAELKAGGACPNNGNQVEVGNFIIAQSDKLAKAVADSSVGPPTCGVLPETGQTQCDQGAGTLGPCPGSPAGQDGAVLAGATRSYTDNGDGTITDNVTGLMWEKLSDDGSIHDWDDVYTWYDAFNAKIAALNSGGGFAGHTDWRLPNRFELDTLADFGHFNPAIDPKFNTACAAFCNVTACACTQSNTYWSSTTRSSAFSTYAWTVDFTAGDVFNFNSKANFSLYVRAVRGGS